jgi:hypothetical protein
LCFFLRFFLHCLSSTRPRPPVFKPSEFFLLRHLLLSTSKGVGGDTLSDLGKPSERGKPSECGKLSECGKRLTCWGGSCWRGFCRVDFWVNSCLRSKVSSRVAFFCALVSLGLGLRLGSKPISSMPSSVGGISSSAWSYLCLHS